MIFFYENVLDKKPSKKLEHRYSLHILREIMKWFNDYPDGQIVIYVDDSFTVLVCDSDAEFDIRNTLSLHKE
jgi:hypothetical protein